MFSIEFLEDGPSCAARVADKQRPDHPKPEVENQHLVCRGRITIGAFSEVFESPLDYWRPQDYRSQWYGALRRLLDGATQTALITQMYDPAVANFIMCWPMYRGASLVSIQNHLLFMDQLKSPFAPELIDDLIPEHAIVGEDGDRISQWIAALDDIVAFLHRVHKG